MVEMPLEIRDRPKQGTTSCCQGEVPWKPWQIGTHGYVCLTYGVIECTKMHEEITGAVLTFHKDANQIYPGWKEGLHYIGESSIQSAPLTGKRKRHRLDSLEELHEQREQTLQ